LKNDTSVASKAIPIHLANSLNLEDLGFQLMMVENWEYLLPGLLPSLLQREYQYNYRPGPHILSERNF
jgi:hypothetical protein